MIPGQAKFAGGIVCAFFSIIGKLYFYGDLLLQFLIMSPSVSIFSFKNFVILSIHNPSLGSCEAPHKTWARSVQFSKNENGFFYLSCSKMWSLSTKNMNLLKIKFCQTNFSIDNNSWILNTGSILIIDNLHKSAFLSVRQKVVSLYKNEARRSCIFIYMLNVYSWQNDLTKLAEFCLGNHGYPGSNIG